jgi:hypothetical protein
MITPPLGSSLLWVLGAAVDLGFIGDAGIISGIEDCFADSSEWRKSFVLCGRG